MSYLKDKILKKNKLATIICYILLAYILLIAISRIFSYSIDIEGMEFSFLYHLQLLKKYGTVYTNPDKYPYFICFYPPFYSAFMYKCCSIFKINVFTDLHRALVLGRLISLILIFINASYIKKIIELLTTQQIKKIQILILLFLLFPAHYFTFRPDSLKITFFILFIYQFLTYQIKTNEHKNLFYAIIFAFTSIFFKHDALIYIYVFLAINWLYFKSNKSVIFSFGLSSLLVVGLFFCIKIYGSFFIKNLFFYTIQYSALKQINFHLIELNIAKTTPLIILSYLNFRSEQKNIKFIVVVSFIYALISNVMLLRAGSNLNYTYECSVFLTINAMIYFVNNEKKVVLYLVIVFYMLVYTNKQIDPKYVDEKSKIELQKEYLQNIASAKQIKNIIGNDVVFFTNGKYIIFNSQLNLMYGYDLHLDRFTEVYLNIPIQSTMFKNKSVKEYDQYFKNGFVKYIVVENNAISLQQMQQYYPNYQYLQAINNLRIYKFPSTHQ